MAWWTAVPAATRAVYKGTRWVKQMKKLKKGGGSTVKNIQSGTKPKNKARINTAKHLTARHRLRRSDRGY